MKSPATIVVGSMEGKMDLNNIVILSMVVIMGCIVVTIAVTFTGAAYARQELEWRNDRRQAVSALVAASKQLADCFDARGDGVVLLRVEEYIAQAAARQLQAAVAEAFFVIGRLGLLNDPIMHSILDDTESLRRDLKERAKSEPVYMGHLAENMFLSIVKMSKETDTWR